MIADFVKGIVVGLGASIPLGPIGVYCVQRTLSKGKWAGFATGLVATIMDVFYSAIAILGLTFINDFIMDNRIWVMIIGGIIVALFGVKLLITNPIKQIRRVNKSKSQYIQDAVTSFIMAVTNPGALLLVLGIIAFVGIDIGPTDSKILIAYPLLGVFCGSMSWWMTLSITINKFRNKFRLRTLLLINRVAGALIIVLGMISSFEGLANLMKQ